MAATDLRCCSTGRCVGHVVLLEPNPESYRFMTGESAAIDLVVVTCEGRERLLERTLTSFAQACPFPFARRILAIDGPFDTASMDAVRPDFVVHSRRRRGYVGSILDVLPHVNTQQFFWLEDDWEFLKPFDLSGLAARLAAYPTWVQLRLARWAPLNDQERSRELAPDIYESVVGFSANPALNTTSHVVRAFDRVRTSPLRERVGFENALTEWFDTEHLQCAVLDPGSSPFVAHSGYLESTDRRWHMTASLDAAVAKHHVDAYAMRPSLLQRLGMVAKLGSAFARIASRQLWNLATYELAFRVVASSKHRDSQ